MSSNISVVIPTYNSALVIEDCIKSVLMQIPSPQDIVVCDGGSQDQTLELARRLKVNVLQTQANRSLQRNLGALAAKNDFILFLDSDMRLSSTVLSECEQLMKEEVAGVCFPEKDVGLTFWCRVKGFERSFYENVWWLEAARCFRRSDFIFETGFNVELISTEDWDLDERMKKYGKIVRGKSYIYHEERFSSVNGFIHKKRGYSSNFKLFSQLHPERARLCFSVVKRLCLFLKKPFRILLHPILSICLVYLGIKEFMLVNKSSGTAHFSGMEKPLDASFNPLKVK